MTTVAILGLILILLPMAVGLYTDFLWFGEVDFRGVFNRVILVRVALFVIFALLGGAVVRVGDEIIDGSVAGRLDALRRTLR